MAEVAGNLAGIGESLADNLNPLPWGNIRRIETGIGLVRRGAAIFDASHKGGHNIAESVALTGMVLAADMVGVTSIADAVEGKDLLTGDRLSGTQRATLGITGTAQLIGTATGISGAATKIAGKLSPKSPPAARPPLSTCFPAGTLVSTGDGLRPIEKLTAHDSVWGFDFEALRWRLCPVVMAHRRDYQGVMVAVTIGAETIEATAGHPFWVVRGERLWERPAPEHVPVTEGAGRVEGRWVDAGELRAGDILRLHGERTATVDWVQMAERELVVYNITVAGLSNYAVGCTGVLVHNTNADLPTPKPGATPEPIGPVREGIYEFPDHTAGGTPYVGQSGNIPRRLGQHEASGRLKPGTETVKEVPGGKTAREIAEHTRIQELTGGQAARNSPNVANKVDPIGPNRRPGFGLPDPAD